MWEEGQVGGLSRVLTKGGSMNLTKRMHPSKSYINSALKICGCVQGCCPSISIQLCLRPVPGVFGFLGFSSRVHDSSRRSIIFSLFVTVSYKSRGHLKGTTHCFRRTGRATYVSRRIDGRDFTRRGCVFPSTDSAYRLVYRLLSARGVAGRVTRYLCAKVIASAKIFRCSYASSSAVGVTNVLVSGKVSFAGVISRTFGRGACGRGHTVKRTLLSDELHLNNEMIASFLALRRVRTLRILPGRVRKVIRRVHGAGSIRLTMFLCRGRSRAFGMDFHMGNTFSTTSLTVRFNNNKRIGTTKYAIRKPTRRTVRHVLTRIRGELWCSGQGCGYLWETKLCFL